jgi:hypothetical protein
MEMFKELTKEKDPFCTFFQKKELRKVERLCIWGFSKPVFQACKKWVEEKKERGCIFIEEEGKEELISDHPQVEIYCLQTPLQLEPLWKKICWETLFMRKELITFQTEEKRHRFEEVSALMETISLGVELTFSEYSDFGLLSLSNIFQNLLHTRKCVEISSLKGSFSKIPAIILGASPSLNQQLPLLQKMKNQALLFAGGSALNVLSAFGLQPHFAASVDKEAPYERFKMQTSWEIPFFYQNQISSLNFSIVHAPLIRVGGYLQLPLERWLEKRLSLNEECFDGGWTVATFLLSLAEFLGCDPILMVGMDFSFEKDPYAKGVFVEKGVRKELLCTKDRKGKRVWTQRDWLMARKWVEEFSLKKKIRLIDASLGLSFQGVEKKSLKDFSKELTCSFDLLGMVHARLARSLKISLSKKELLDLLEEFTQSLSKVEKILDKEMERGKKRNSLSFEEIEGKLLKEKSYLLFLEPLWKIWSPLFERNGSLQERAIHQILFLKRVVIDSKKKFPTLRRKP